MGLRKEHSIYKNFLFFFNKDPNFIRFRDPEEHKQGWFSVPPDCQPNEICNSESMMGTMDRFGKANLDLFNAWRKSELKHEY